MKKIIAAAIFFLLMNATAWACPVCERNQPKVLRGVVHGQGPDGFWDYVIVWAAVVISIVTFYYAVKWLVRPGEKNKNHIKYFILNED